MWYNFFIPYTPLERLHNLKDWFNINSYKSMSINEKINFKSEVFENNFNYS